MKIYTTLKRIKDNDPCVPGWEKLLSYLNKTQADDDPLDLLTILESNGVQDCLWAFQCTDDNESIYRLIAADFAESVLLIYEKEYPNDDRPRKAIQAARDYANGNIDYAAWSAARAAAMAAAWSAAWSAAGSAARAAAWDAAWSAARAAAMAAARAAAWDAAWDARAAARDAERERQRQIIIKYLS